MCLLQAEEKSKPLVSIVESAVARHDGGKQNALVLGSGGGLVSFMLTRTFPKVRRTLP